RAPASAARLAPHARVSTAYNIFGRHPRHGARKRIGRARERSPRVCKAWARVPAGIANARARSVAAPIVNREPQKSTAEGRKCGQLFSVEREGVSPQYVPPFMGPSLTVSPWAPSSPPLLCRRHRLSTCAGIGRIPPRLLHPELRLALPRRAKSVGG